MTTTRHVRFTKAFDYSPKFGVVIAYPAGREYYVRAECAAQAIAGGCAEPVESPEPGPGVAQTIEKKRRGKRQ